MDADTVVQRCREHIHWASKAAAAKDYVLYIIEKLEAELLEEFKTLDLSKEADVKAMIAAKQQFDGIAALKETMESHITSGKLAHAKLVEIGVIDG